MKNFPKAGLLILTLVTPALIFVFLKFFGTNHYVLPYYNPQINSEGQILVENGDTLFRKSTIIRLKSSEVNLLGKLTVVNYLPETCEDSCLLMLAQLQRINNLAAEVSGLSLITLTGTSNIKNLDYPEELGKQNWKVQLSNKEEATNAFKLLLGSESGVIENKLVLIDKGGFTRGFYNGADPEDADRLMAEIKILQYEYKNSTH